MRLSYLFLVFVSIYSCKIEKHRYSRGFHIEWRQNKQLVKKEIESCFESESCSSLNDSLKQYKFEIENEICLSSNSSNVKNDVNTVIVEDSIKVVLGRIIKSKKDVVLQTNFSEGVLVIEKYDSIRGYIIGKYTRRIPDNITSIGNIDTNYAYIHIHDFEYIEGIKVAFKDSAILEVSFYADNYNLDLSEKIKLYQKEKKIDQDKKTIMAGGTAITVVGVGFIILMIIIISIIATGIILLPLVLLGLI